MCILCPIKVLLPTSHVFNRFMFSICEASSHLSRLVSFMFSQRKIDHMRILFSSRRIVSVPVRKVTHPRNVHFLDVPFWSHLIFRRINGRKRESVAKSYPGAEWHTLMKNPLAHVLLLSCQSSLESSLHPNRPLLHPLIFPTSVHLAWLHPNKCFSTLPTIVRGCSVFDHPVQQSCRS